MATIEGTACRPLLVVVVMALMGQGGIVCVGCGCRSLVSRDRPLKAPSLPRVPHVWNN